MSLSGNPPVFTGVYNLLSTINRLCHRRGFWHRAHHDEVRGETALPLLCLVRDEGTSEFLTVLSTKLDLDSSGRIPHLLINTSQPRRQTHPAEDTSQIDPAALPLLPLLNQIQQALQSRTYGGEALSRFDRFRLADFLTREHLAVTSQRDDRVNIVRRLRHWLRLGRHQLDPTVNVEAGGLTFGLWLLVSLGPILRFWIWTRSREARWFMKQSYLTAHSPDFIRFAQRLTREHREAGSDYEVKKLLVHAFLEDLRVEYRRRLLGFRPQSWRRTAHTVVLLDNLSESSEAWELLRLINDVRNETGDPDPLLVIAAADHSPPRSNPAHLVTAPADRASLVFIRWQRELPTRRQRKEVSARYLTIALPPSTNHPTAELSPLDEYAWDQVVLRARTAPFLARRYIMASLVTVLVAISSGLGVSSTMPRWDADCFPFSADGTGLTELYASMTADSPRMAVRPMMSDGGWECVGYSDSPSQIFGDDTRLRVVQQMIFQANTRAAEIRRDHPEKPLVSLVYFGALTRREQDPAKDDTLSEELEGMLLQQRTLNTENNFDKPLLRVIVANGGDQMLKAPLVARKMLVPLLDQDSTILGVIGLDRTTTDTQKVISKLGDLGIPTVGTTLTGIDLTDRSYLYYQMVPDNSKQAELVESYAKTKEKSLTVYYPQKPGDTYTSSLVGEFPPEQRVSYRRASQIKDITCNRQQIAFFAGRGSEFPSFLEHIVKKCSELSKLPHIIGSDATARFITSGARKRKSLKGIPVSYVSLGGQLVLAGQDCIKSGRPSRKIDDQTPIIRFCSTYNDLDPEITGPRIVDLPSERTGVAYDATSLFLEALEATRDLERDNEEFVPHRAAVAAALPKVDFDGVTGSINFTDSQILQDKMISIVCFDDIQNVNAQPKVIHVLNGIEQAQEATCQAE